MTLQNILVAVGPKDSERADELAEAVLEVAQPAAATVHLTHVFTPGEFEEATDRLNFESSTTADPDAVAQRHETIRALIGALEDAGIEYAVHGRVGDHAEKIVELAGELDADRVVVGGRKRSPSGKAVFGSIAQDVMLESPCPVTFVKGA
ncbi:universal stress protein [Halorhabdus tiamatea SARL4B]|uniref:Universal stress protein n=1 Tax=Halorhabdus tiamatea SARL4B TaxID=1033806 RepID=F7PLE6_9EURY|nr:universal stress protein [Halorhabdus tiamatea]ERJ04801.1 universal stress protein [Halorhabdus tiamatea SARL4B]CCQ33072.1 universal stress protein A (UpsA) domain protein [Halorhabdus tiamatea SARL4B]